MRQLTISVIVTAFNEALTIEAVLREAWPIVNTTTDQFEFLLVDDGSTDGTAAIVDRLAAEFPNVRAIHNDCNVGWGASYMRGVKAARYDYVMLLCGDGGLPSANIPAIIGQIGTADIVIPYMRNLHEIKTPFRFIVSRVYTKFLNLISGLRLRYYNGLAIHRRELVSSLDVRSTGFGFQAEILIKLLKAGHSFVEIGVDGAAKQDQRSVLVRPRNILNVLRTCALLLRECRDVDSATRPHSRGVRM